MSTKIDNILLELSYRVPEGFVDLTKPHQIAELVNILHEFGVSNPTRVAVEAGKLFTEKDDADAQQKATMAKDVERLHLIHAGGGYYKQSENGPITYKTDNGKLVKVTPEESDRINKGAATTKKEPTATEPDQTKGEPQQPQIDPATQLKGKELVSGAEERAEKVNATTKLSLKPAEIDKAVGGLQNIIQKDFPSELKDKLGQTGIDALTSSFKKMIGDQQLTAQEKELLKKFVTLKDKPGLAVLYIATQTPGDFKKHKKVEFGSSKEAALKNITQSLGMGAAKAQEGLMARKEVVANKVTSARKDIITEQNADGSITIEGVVHKAIPIPDEKQLASELNKKGVENSEVEAKTTIATLKRYNRQLEMMKESGKFQVVDFGDTTTPEGRVKTFDNFKQLYVKKFSDIFSKSEDGLKQSDTAILDKLSSIQFPVDGNTEQFESNLDSLLGQMTLNKDFRTAVPDLLEGIVFCKMLGRGYHAFLPSSETFKVSDVIAFKEPNLKVTKGESPAKHIADNFKMIKTTLVMVGGQSVKFEEGGAGQSDAKVDQTEYKHPETKQILKSLLSNYQFVFNKKQVPYPPDNIAIGNKEKEINNHLEWAVKNNILSENDRTRILARADELAGGAFQSAMRNGVGPLNDEEKRDYKRLLRVQALSGSTIESINNSDTDFNYFSNERSRVNERTGEVKNEELDGIVRKCCMSWSNNPGYKFVMVNGKKWMSPGNVNTSHIVPCDKKKR